MPVTLLHHKNQKLRIYPRQTVECLERRPRSDEAIGELDRLHRERGRLLCECGRVLHVVQRDYPFLRRNPGQNTGGVECALCEASHLHEIQVEGERAARFEKRSIGLILETRIHAGESDEGRNEAERGRHSGGVRSRLKYARAFSVFFTLMEGAGFTSLATSLGWNDAWRRIHRQLSCIQIHPASQKTVADFCWMPGGLYKGGLRGMNERLLEWDHPKYQPEGWLFGILNEVPEAETVSVSAISNAMLRKNTAEGREVYAPYLFSVPNNNIAVIGKSGPYLMLAAASVNNEGSMPYSKPIFHRLLLQSIAGEHNPVPVESNYERETVFLLQRMGVPFIKPVFDDADGLRPDFVLLKHGLIIEVQGLNSDEYRDRKKQMHQRLTESARYRGFGLVTYDANDGQTLFEFERKIRRAVSLRSSGEFYEQNRDRKQQNSGSGREDHDAD